MEIAQWLRLHTCETKAKEEAGLEQRGTLVNTVVTRCWTVSSTLSGRNRSNRLWGALCPGWDCRNRVSSLGGLQVEKWKTNAIEKQGSPYITDKRVGFLSIRACFNDIQHRRSGPEKTGGKIQISAETNVIQPQRVSIKGIFFTLQRVKKQFSCMCPWSMLKNKEDSNTFFKRIKNNNGNINNG